MKTMQSRRRFLTTLSSAGAAGLIGAREAAGQEAPPETTTLRLTRIPGICIAPQYVAENLFKAEGFTDVQYVDVGIDIYSAFAAGKVDFSIAFVAPFIAQVDMNVPITLIAGVHVGCYELFGREHVQAIRDLKGKTVAIPALKSPHHMFLASMLAHVGVDANRDVTLVTHPVSESAQMLNEGRVDALIGFPPVPQELREKKIGHVIVNSGLDRPWAQYFCCVVGATQDFVRKYPVATKRALRAILKATDFCSSQPEQAARIVADRGYRYDYSLQTMKEIRYPLWRDYDVEDAVRFYSLRLREAGMIKSPPQKIIAQGTDWRFFNELKRELKG